MDGLVCCAGVSNSCGNLKLIISLNYFGAMRLAEGVFDLLEKRRGACVVVVSNTISQGAARMDVVNLLNNQMDEPRVLALMDRLDAKKDAHAMYVATKYALARWMRRVSADWAAHGVRINAIAPGNVETAMTAKLSPHERVAVLALPSPPCTARTSSWTRRILPAPLCSWCPSRPTGSTALSCSATAEPMPC